MPSRRTILAALSASAGGAVAGCIGSDSASEANLTEDQRRAATRYERAFRWHTGEIDTMDEVFGTTDTSDRDALVDDLDDIRERFEDASGKFDAASDPLDPDESADAITIAEHASNIATTGAELADDASSTVSAVREEALRDALRDHRAVYERTNLFPTEPEGFRAALAGEDRTAATDLESVEPPEPCAANDPDGDFRCAEGAPLEVRRDVAELDEAVRVSGGRIDLACTHVGAGRAIEYTRPRLRTRSGLRSGIGGPTDEAAAHFEVYVGDSGDGPADPITVEEVLRTAPAFVRTVLVDADEEHACTVPVIVTTYDRLATPD